MNTPRTGVSGDWSQIVAARQARDVNCRIGALVVGCMAWTARASWSPVWYVTPWPEPPCAKATTLHPDDLLANFTSMPWPLGIYAIAMTLLGTLLVVGAPAKVRFAATRDELICVTDEREGRGELPHVPFAMSRCSCSALGCTSAGSCWISS
jgi:hypothetical protein